jgi:hypothetical protein
MSVAVVCLLGLAGCAAPRPAAPGVKATGGTDEGVAAEVGGRAQKRWDALVAGDVEGAYKYLSPGSRQVTTVGVYGASIRLGFWKKAVVQRVECLEPDVCQVHVMVDYLVRGSPVTSPLLESWARSDQEWWYVLK